MFPQHLCKEFVFHCVYLCKGTVVYSYVLRSIIVCVDLHLNGLHATFYNITLSIGCVVGLDEPQKCQRAQHCYCENENMPRMLQLAAEGRREWWLKERRESQQANTLISLDG